MIRLPDRAHSRAFLFGTASYESDELPDLPAVANNLQDLREALTSPVGAFAAERCTVLLDPPGAIPLYDALNHLATEATDTLLIYFAGHGLRKLLGGGLHLALPHTRSDNQAVSGFDYGLLREIVNSSRATNKIVIVDSCFSGRAIQSMSGVTQELDIEGSCLLTSTTGNQQALAPAGERHTTFSGALIHLLRHGIPEAGPLLSFGAIGDELRRRAQRQGIPLPDQLFHGTARHIALTRNPAAPSSGAAPPTAPPPPRPTAQHAYVSRPLLLAGTSHSTKKGLAETVRKQWATASDRYFRRMGTQSHPSESWSELRSWMRQFNDPRGDDVEGRNILIDRHLSHPVLPHDHKLLHLLRWLDPQGPVVYQSRSITYTALARVCLHRYLDGGRHDAELLKELSGQHRLLDTLAGFDALDQLRDVQRKWDKALKSWHDTDTTSWPPEVRDWAADVGPGALLAALLPQEHLTKVRRRLPATGRPPVPSTGWYSQLIQAAGGRQTLLGRLAEVEWSARARQEGLAEARAEEERRRAQQERRRAEQERRRTEQAERERQQEEARKAEELRLRRKREQEQRRLADEPRLREERRRAEEERQRRHREAQEAEQERQRRLNEWRATEAARLRPAARTRAVLRAFALGAVWALFPIVAVWGSWWFSSFEYDAAQALSALACIASAAALYRLVPCAYRLGGAFRPRPHVPATWLPPVRPTLAVGALLLCYGLIGGGSSARSGDIKADSDYLREVGLGSFLRYVGQNGSSASFGDTLIALLLLPMAAGCLWTGLQAGATTARRWADRHTKAEQEARGHVPGR
ncbi:caspase family protein [Streptomyces sp. Lzd4kr]|nr:caspase family protein [Streptomyces sp. Lzd4kr]